MFVYVVGVIVVVDVAVVVVVDSIVGDSILIVWIVVFVIIHGVVVDYVGDVVDSVVVGVISIAVAVDGDVSDTWRVPLTFTATQTGTYGQTCHASNRPSSMLHFALGLLWRHTSPAHWLRRH